MSESVWIKSYRKRASAHDITALSGRPGRGDINRHIAETIVDAMPPADRDTIVDVGCGDGSVLVEMLSRVCGVECIGILPTSQEVARLSSYLRGKQIRVIEGLADSIQLPDATADKAVCNGVLMMLEYLSPAIAELARITKSGGTVLLGEMPHCDEVEHSAAETRMLRECTPYYRIVIDRLRKEGPIAIWLKIRNVFGVPRVPKGGINWTAADDLIEMARTAGLQLLEKWPSPTLNHDGQPATIPTRTTYLFKKV